MTQDAVTLERTPPGRANEVDAAEVSAFTTLLRALGDDDWALGTDCTLWTVRDVVAHVVGATVELAHPQRLIRNVFVSARRYPHMSKLDALNQMQVDERADRPGPQLVDDLQRLTPSRLRTRERMPGFIRRIPLPAASTLPRGSRVEYMLDVIAIRDVWMHRVDISVATGRDMVLGEHDGEVVRQVIRDLGRSWRAPAVELVLEGPAGGTWTLGSGMPRATVRVDAVEYMRLLAGRPADPKIVIDGDDAVRTSINQARVVF